MIQDKKNLLFLMSTILFLQSEAFSMDKSEVEERKVEERKGASLKNFSTATYSTVNERELLKKKPWPNLTKKKMIFFVMLT